jgi:hypothetical protein
MQLSHAHHWMVCSSPIGPAGPPRQTTCIGFLVVVCSGKSVRPRVGWIEHSVDYTQSVGKWEVVEIGLGLENPSISLADAVEEP